MQRLFFYPIILVLTYLFVMSTPAEAGRKEEIKALQNQLVAMQQQFEALSQRTGQNIAESTVRISQLQQQNQELTGRVESLNFELDRMRARLDQVTRVLAGESFSGLETSPQGVAAGNNVSGNGVGPAAGNAASGAPAPLGGNQGAAQAAVGGDATSNLDASAVDATRAPSRQSPSSQSPVGESPTGQSPNGQSTRQGQSDVSLPPDPNVAYQYASGFLLSGDYIRAREAFELYVQEFPNSARLPDAQFRLGEIYLATGANADAAQAFISHIREFPNDPKAAEAYLKLGTSFARLDKKDQACQVYQQIRPKFPGAAQIIFQRSELEMQRLGCR